MHNPKAAKRRRRAKRQKKAALVAHFAAARATRKVEAVRDALAPMVIGFGKLQGAIGVQGRVYHKMHDTSDGAWQLLRGNTVVTNEYE